MRIATKAGLQELLKRYKESGLSLDDCGIKDYWVIVIEESIEQGLPMDEMDYENTPKELRKLWRGLK